MSDPKKPYVIVVGVDYSEGGLLALEQAVALAAQRPHAELHAIHVLAMIPPPLPVECVVPPQLSTTSLEEAAQTLGDHLAKALGTKLERGVVGVDRLRVFTHVRMVMPSYEIAQLAADLDADLVVVGSHGRRGLPRCILGSVAEEVVRLAPCPVFVARPKRIVTLPKIEPPCAECVKTREESGRQNSWCAAHCERHGQRHTYHQGERISSDGSLPLVFRS